MFLKKICIVFILGLFTAVLLFSDGGEAYRILKNGKWGAIDAEGRIVIPPEYDYIYPFHNGATVVYNGEYGEAQRAFVSADGTFITDFEFDRAYHFFGELAVVVIDGKQGYIDRQGNRVTDAEFTLAYDFKDGRAPVGYGSYRERKYGVITADGSFAIKPVYDKIYQTSDPELFRAQLGEKWGIISLAGEEIIPFRYNTLIKRGDFFRALNRDDSGLTSYVFDKAGRMVLEKQDVFVLGYEDGFIIFRSENGMAGVMDENGRTVIDPEYNGIEALPGGLFKVWSGNYRTRRFGIYDSAGTVLLPQVYRTMHRFDENGLAVVADESGYGVINRKAQIVAGCIYENIRPFSEGLAAVNRDGKWGFIDTEGKEVIEPAFDWVFDFSEGLAVFREGDFQTGKRGYIDTAGRIVIPARYDWAYSFENGVAHVAFGDFFSGKFGYIDTNGSYLWEPSR
jgi:hypothetical protein